MVRNALALVLALLLGPGLLGSGPTEACELCDGPGSSFVSLQNHISTWPLVALGEPVGRTREGRLQFKITRVLKGGRNLAIGARVAPRGASAVLPGHVWLLLGAKANFQLGTVLMLRPATLDFLLAAPRLPSTKEPAKRLRALLPWLRHADPMVAASARKEFAEAPFEAVRTVARYVVTDDLLATLAKPEAAATSRGALFLLVGLSGGPAERKRLGTWLQDPAMQRAPGFDALLAAWLMLTGPEGVIPIERILRDPKVEATIVGSAYVRALGFHARNTKVLRRPQVLGALHQLLNRPAFFGTTLSELVRLEAWGELEPVLAAYESQKAKAPWMVGPVLRYLAAHPSPEAKRAHDRIEQSLLGAKPAPGKGPSGKGTPAKGSSGKAPK
jgi:hypothetical protein